MTGQEIIKAVEDALDHLKELDEMIINLKSEKNAAERTYNEAVRRNNSLAHELQEAVETRQSLNNALYALRTRIFKQTDI